MSEHYTLAKKQQISRILDIFDQDSEAQNAVHYLGTEALNLPMEMTREQYFELTKCRTRKRNFSSGSESSSEAPVDKSLFGQKETIYVKITNDDSLVKLALKYNCHVSELKFANKIYNDKELHALKTVKVPVVKDGAIYDEYHKTKSQETKNQVTDMNSQISSDWENTSRQNRFDMPKPYIFNSILDYMSSDDDDEIYNFQERHQSESDHLLSEPVIATRKKPSGRMSNECDVTIHEYMEEVDKKVREKVNEIENKEQTLKEVASAIPAQVTFLDRSKERPEQFGSVCSFTWSHCLLVVCLIAVIIPIGYLFYFFYHRKPSS